MSELTTEMVMGGVPLSHEDNEHDKLMHLLIEKLVDLVAGSQIETHDI